MNTPQDENTGSRRLAAVWFADIVDFTRLSGENEPLALRLIETLQGLATAAVESNEGKIVKFMGDGVLAEFASTEGAALGGIQLLLQFGRLAEDWPEGPHLLRLGMHLGDITVAPDGDIYGDGVNRAARLEGLAAPGTLLVSEDVFRQLRNRPDLVLTKLGTRKVKGYEDRLRIYDAAPTEDLRARLIQEAGSPEELAQTIRATQTARATGPTPRGRSSRPIAVGLTVGLLSFIALGVWTAFGSPESETPTAEFDRSAILPPTDSFSIAVLPFRFLSAEENYAYIADGISEELIHALSSVPELRVASRTSSFQYREAQMDVAELAARLGVLMVIEGSVQKVEDDLRVTAQLIDVDQGGMQIWSQGWDSKADDVLGLQGNIAQAVVDELLNTAADANAVAAKLISPGGDGVGTAAVDPEAYDLLMRGRHELAQGTPEGATTAEELFARAVELAPYYARAHLALAQAQIEVGTRGARPLVEVLPLGRGHLEAALLHDPDLVPARAALASLLATFEWDWEPAEREFRTALVMAPTPTVRRTFAEMLSARGRHEEAIAQVAMAFRQEPGAVANVAAQGLALFRARSYTAAEVVLTESLRLDPGDEEVRVHLARTQNILGDIGQARITLAGADSADRSNSLQLWRARFRIASVGVEQGGGDQVVRRLRGSLSPAARDPDAPYHLAALRLSLGDRPGTVAALQRAMNTPSPSLIWLPTDPMWDEARSVPQFQRLVQRIDKRDGTP